MLRRLRELNPEHTVFVNNCACGAETGRFPMAVVPPRRDNFDNYDTNVGSSSLQPGFLDQLRAVPGYVRAFGRRIGPASELLQALARAHPHAPHWYLYVVGVDPSHQGRGVAGTLLRSRLDRCDVAGDPAYLEATSVATVPLYAHLGFEATGTPALPSGAPVVTAMWRAPAGRAAR